MLSHFVGGAGAQLDWTKPYLLVVQHPVTTEFGSGLDQINETISAIDGLEMQTLWLWPNVDAGSDDVAKGIRLYRERRNPSFVHFYRNFSPEDYLRVMNNCVCIVGNSSSGLREGAFLGTPCVNIGSRQAMRERGANVMDAPYDAKQIRHAIETQVAHGRYPSDPIFGNGTAGQQMADVLARIPLSIHKKLNYVYDKQ